MRYSVVLPRVDPGDSEDGRRALEEARLLWAKGKQRAALDLVEKAAQAAIAAGNDRRATVLTRAAQAIAQEIEPKQAADVVPVSAPRPSQKVPRPSPSDVARPREPQAADEPVADGPLVVTIAPSGWTPAGGQALVGQAAVRVAISSGAGPGSFSVRPLGPGEIAPEGTRVALLVALDPDGLPV